MRQLAVRNPRTGQADHAIAALDAAEVAAVAADLRARQAGWAALGVEGRVAALGRLKTEVAARAEALTDALIADTGRTRISRIEVGGFLGQLDRWAALAPDLLAPAPPRPSATPGIRIEAATRPYPLVGCISPWNFPLTLAMIDAVPALAAGCAVIIKPSEVTPRFIGPLAEALAAVPDIPCRLIEGDGLTGAALVEQVDFVAFTGSVPTGRKVALAAAGRLIPASLELGGKDPMLVLASADPAWAASVALRASVVNTGQACQSIERLHVARPIHDAFLKALAAQAQAARLSFPDPHAGDIGPFIFERQAAIVQAQIDDALARGARLLAGGRVEELGGGLYLKPTVLADVTFDMAIMQEETFGPVLPVMAFDSLEEGIAQANTGPYGLSAAVLAGSEAEALAVAPRLNAGAVSIQDGALTSMVWDAEKSSFGASGLGPSRMGASGLLRFLRRQAILVQEGAALPLKAYAEDAR